MSRLLRAYDLVLSIANNCRLIEPRVLAMDIE